MELPIGNTSPRRATPARVGRAWPPRRRLSWTRSWGGIQPIKARRRLRARTSEWAPTTTRVGSRGRASRGSSTNRSCRASGTASRRGPSRRSRWHPDRSSCRAWREARDGRRVEQPSASGTLGPRSSCDVLRRAGAGEDVADRRPVRPLPQRVDRHAGAPRRRAPQDVLLLEPAQPQPVGQRRRELGDPKVEVRETGPRPSCPSASGLPARAAGTPRASVATSRYWARESGG